MKGINAKVTRRDRFFVRVASDCVRAAVERREAFSPTARREGALLASAGRIGGVKASVAVIFDSGFYLRVTPEYIWLMPGNDFADNAEILSNTKWETKY